MEEIMEKVEKQVAQELEGKIQKEMLGYRYYFDLRKKEILKEAYGIEWETWQEQHEGCSMD